MEFVIPLDKDELLKPQDGQIYVHELVGIKNVQEALNGKREFQFFTINS